MNKIKVLDGRDFGMRLDNYCITLDDCENIDCDNYDQQLYDLFEYHSFTFNEEKHEYVCVTLNDCKHLNGGSWEIVE